MSRCKSRSSEDKRLFFCREIIVFEILWYFWVCNYRLIKLLQKRLFGNAIFSLKKIRRKNADVLDVNINSKNALTIVFQIRLHFLFFGGCCIRADGLRKKIERLRKLVDFPVLRKAPVANRMHGAALSLRSVCKVGVAEAFGRHFLSYLAFLGKCRFVFLSLPLFRR